MAISDTTFIARSLTGRTFSTVVTSLTVAVAVALMLVLFGMKDAARRSLDRGAGNMHLLLSAQASSLESVLNSVYYTAPPGQFINRATFARLEAGEPWDWFIPTQLGDSYRGRPVMGTTREFFERFEPVPGRPWALQRGRVFESTWEIVLGADAAHATGLVLDDVISLTHGVPRVDDGAHVHNEFRYRVVGVLGPTGTAHDRAMFTPIEAAWVLHAHDRRLADLGPGVSLTTVDDLTDADRNVTAVYARLITREGATLSAAMQAVFNRLRADPSITVASPAQEMGSLFVIVDSVDLVIRALVVVVLLSSAVGILLALTNTMEQRRRQIAMLRVLGASQARVFGLVLTESAVLGFLGAVTGAVLSLVGSRLVAGVVYDQIGLVIDPSLPPRLVLGVVVVTVALAALAGLPAAISAYRTGVVRNLRPLG